jgi:hypothetical protein
MVPEEDDMHWFDAKCFRRVTDNVSAHIAFYLTKMRMLSNYHA